MTEETVPTPAKKTSFWLDFGPLLIFFGAFQYFKRTGQTDQAMLYAAGIFAVAAVIALGISWVRHKTVSGILILSTVIIVLTAGLALATGNKTIFYMKPTIVNILFGLAMLAGLVTKYNPAEMMMGSAFSMERPSWNKLAVRWALFFFAMAILNELIWRNFSEDFWATFKVFGFLPLTFLFVLTQIPFLNKHGSLRSEETS